MKRYLIGAGVGFVAIAAAVLLFPSPDTGADVTASATPDPTPVIAVVERADASPAVNAPSPQLVALRTAKKDARQASEDRRAAPESKAAAELTGPIGGLRYTLSRTIGEPEAIALAQALEPAHKQLNALRRAPDADNLVEILSELDRALEDVRGSSYASHDGIATAIERYDTLRAAL